MDGSDEKIAELLKLTQDNNKILHSMRRSQRWSSFISLVYWAFIIGSIFGVYYYFQPTIEKYTQMLQSSMQVLEKFKGQ